MITQNQGVTAMQTLLDQLSDELCRHNRGLVTELPRWMR